MKTPFKKTTKGFTLIELLVAMAITTIIITILVSITGLSLDAWNRSRSEVSASRQGKAMVDSMSRDLESLVVRKGNNFEWLHASFSPTTSGPNGSDTASPNAADFVFFSAVTDRYNGEIGVTGQDLGGDVSTIVYQLKYKNPIDGTTGGNYDTFVLYRKIINPDATFDNTLGLAFNSTGTALLDAAETEGDSVDEESNFICENIYQFSLTFNVDVDVARPSGKIVPITVPVRVGNGSTDTDVFKVGGGELYVDNGIDLPSDITDPETVKSGRLSSVQISVTVLSDFGLKQMRNRTFGNATEKAEFIGKNSYQFSKIVTVPGS